MTYFITIPNKYDYEPHPAGDFTSRDLVQIEADSPAEARELAHRHLGDHWAFYYNTQNLDMGWHPRGVTHFINRDGELTALYPTN